MNLLKKKVCELGFAKINKNKQHFMNFEATLTLLILVKPTLNGVMELNKAKFAL